MTPKARRLRNWASLAVAAFAVVAGMDLFGIGFFPSFFNHPRDRWGESALAVMREADLVEVIRLNHPPKPDHVDGQKPFYGMLATGTPIKPSDSWVERLRDAVDNSRSYDWIWHARCIPTPGVCVRFRRGSDVVDLLLCFECGLVSLAPPDKHGGRIQDQWIDFRVNRTPFTKLVKEVFPNDAAIQGIGK